MIQSKINDMIKQKEYLKLINEDTYVDDIVCINDKVLVSIKYDENDQEEETIKLTGKYLPDDSLNEISLNSPIGRAIYKQAIGTSVTYKVNNRSIEVNLIRKEK